jgi:predicted ATPase
MIGNSPHDFRVRELDPDLLRTFFRIQTNWHVITGVSCSGKTTLISQLADSGFKTVPDVVPHFFERDVQRGDDG